jgi:hypothetical protein
VRQVPGSTAKTAVTGPSADEPALFKNRVAILIEKLQHMADWLKIPNAPVWSAQQKRQIIRAIRRKQGDKLREWHLKKQFVEESQQTGTSCSIPDYKWAMILVRLKHREMEGPRRLTDSVQEANIAYATKASNDAKPIEQRAVALLRGARKKSKEHLIEKEASKIASAVQKEWFVQTKKSGPVKGAVSSITDDGLQYLVPLSVFDICSVVVPIIETSAPRIKLSVGHPDVWKTDPPSAVLVAAVRTTNPGAKIATIAREAVRSRRPTAGYAASES